MSSITLYVILGFGLTYSYIKDYNRNKQLLDKSCAIELQNYLQSLKYQGYQEDLLLKKYYFCVKSVFDK